MDWFVVNEPTFYRDSNSSVLDVVLVSNALCTQISPETCVVKKCDYTSHHHRLSVNLKISRSKQKAQYRTGCKWRNFDDDAFLTDIEKIELHRVTEANEPCEKQWESFSKTLNCVLNKHASIKRLKFTTLNHLQFRGKHRYMQISRENSAQAGHELSLGSKFTQRWSAWVSTPPLYTTALINMTDEILKAMDRSHITLLTILDLSRCFDVINYDTLLEKFQVICISTGCSSKAI